MLNTPSLLDDITSQDPTRVRSAAAAIQRLRDKEALALLVANLDTIKASLPTAEPGKSMVPNAVHLDFVIRKLTFIQQAEGCLCLLYGMNIFFNPVTEEKAGNIRILGTVDDANGYLDYYRCVCSLCEREYKVEEREYHYPWWEWKAA